MIENSVSLIEGKNLVGLLLIFLVFFSVFLMAGCTQNDDWIVDPEGGQVAYDGWDNLFGGE